MQKIPGNNYFPPLTGLRAIAAYMVYCHHFNPISIKHFNGVLNGIINEMHIGVTVFFVLSGFLITHRYYNINNFKFKNYLINRVARIYPIYFLLTTLTFVFWVLNSDEYYINQILLYLLNITFLRGFFENINFSLVSQGWSLTVEETFYLLAPLCFFLIKKRFIFIFFIPFIFILIGLLFVLIGAGSYDVKNYGDLTNYVIDLIGNYGFFGSLNFLFNYTFFGRVFEFFIGIGLALMIKNKIDVKIKFTYLGIFFILISLLALYYLRIDGNFEFGINHPLGIFINTFLLPFLGIAPLIYGLVNEESKISKLLSTKTFIILGKSSFVFYLIHLGVLKKALPIFENQMLSYLFHFFVIQFLAILIYNYLEEPLNKLLKRKLAIY
jgi:peptidoglycan/LPS O-acetylase OafA/YrhL